MNTYKQSIKNKSRIQLWKHAINTVTVNRSNTRILTEEYIRELWMYICSEEFFDSGFLNKIHFKYLNDWCEFANVTYGTKSPKELRVIYLSGPEPENDLKILLQLGISIENIWAVEANEEVYKKALENIKEKYPTLKIFNGIIEDFFEICPKEFDIVYLDFTAPLFSKEQKPFKTVNKLFDNQILSELGVLITNSNVPDKEEEGVEFLTDFFLPHSNIEGTIHGLIGDNEQPITWFGDGAGSHYGYEREVFKEKIQMNFKEAYSSFCSIYPIFYSNLVSPYYRLFNNRAAYKKFFKYPEDKLKEEIKEINTFNYLSETYFFFNSLEDYPAWSFLRSLSSSEYSIYKYWNTVFTQKENGKKFSRLESVILADIFQKPQFWNKQLIKENLLLEIPKITESLSEYELFCDKHFSNNWFEVALNQFGYPYHTNFKNHKRFEYTAKVRTMFIDVFTFDRCRSFYDWLPMLEFYSNDLSKAERQIIARICIDKLGGKQSTFTFLPTYTGTNIGGIGQIGSEEFVDKVPLRVEIN
ncbi:hypothetical protein U5N28_01910 [Lysinibacillus telephonicus]|uniref:hypothetical protein n=1 Tax=Lysinibacillus telephonicus TaxID=1714840 RepID=UPI00397BB683